VPIHPSVHTSRYPAAPPPRLAFNAPDVVSTRQQPITTRSIPLGIIPARPALAADNHLVSKTTNQHSKQNKTPASWRTRAMAKRSTPTLSLLRGS
jgi:hypothetical protein